MNMDPLCISCIINHAYRISKILADGNVRLQLHIVKEVCRAVGNLNQDFSGIAFCSFMTSVVEKASPTKDDYTNMKSKILKRITRLIPYFDAMVCNSNDKLGTALKIAAGVDAQELIENPNLTIRQEVHNIIANKIDEHAFRKLSNDLESAETVLYIGGGYGDALLDKILLRQLSSKRVVFAAKSHSESNEVTLEDAKDLEIDKVCEVIEIGNGCHDTSIIQCSHEFNDLFENADIVIAKGQENYEALMGAERPIYFLFKVKCDPIAGLSGPLVGSSLLYFNNKSGMN